MLKISPLETEAQKSHVRELFEEYLNWVNLLSSRQFNFSFDVNAFLEQDMAKLHYFAPPEGKLLLGEYDEKIAGCAGLRKVNEQIAEIKRVYVRPEFRRKGIARCLVKAIIQEASQIGYTKIRLESASFFKEAHSLYRSLGFQETQPYTDSEIPKQFHPISVFMELIIKKSARSLEINRAD